jgi:crotonobetainyl-CoA:carnitine CoA-transferase CaiB-like acyl-CoA transferase
MPLMGPLDGICAAIGSPELATDPRFAVLGAGNLHQFQDLLAGHISRWSTEEALTIFGRHDVPAGPVIPRSQVHEHPQAVALNSVPEHDDAVIGRVRSARPAWRMSGTPEVLNEGAPIFGEHTDVVLRELGYSQEEVESLRQDGVVA